MGWSGNDSGPSRAKTGHRGLGSPWQGCKGTFRGCEPGKTSCLSCPVESRTVQKLGIRGNKKRLRKERQILNCLGQAWCWGPWAPIHSQRLKNYVRGQWRRESFPAATWWLLFPGMAVREQVRRSGKGRVRNQGSLTIVFLTGSPKSGRCAQSSSCPEAEPRP